jgi:O-acetyl-ADP-ribose deacetylase (regulator of RNase III)
MLSSSKRGSGVFRGVASVEVGQGDIFETKADAIVSPANSFGYMDGGIDAVYLERFGAGLQARLQAVLREEHHGELPVGHAVVVCEAGRGGLVRRGASARRRG